MRDAVGHGTALLALLAACLLVALAALPAARADARPHLAIETLRITPVDTNGDGLYDELRAEVQVLVFVGGNFRLQMTTCLGAVGTGDNEAVAYTDVQLGVGEQNVTAVLPSALLVAACPAHGPYDVFLDVEPVLTDGTFWVSDAMSYATLPANLTLDRFEPAYARVQGPITDYGIDTNGDGLYDFLVVHVPLQVLVRGRVALAGETVATPKFLPHSVVDSLPAPSRVLDPGIYAWDVAFPGATIRSLNWSHPLNVTVTLTLDDLRPAVSWDRTWTFWHNTRPYLPSSFAPAPLFFGPGAPRLVNGSPSAAFAEMDVPLQIPEPGDYAVLADLNPGGLGGFEAQRLVSLGAGAQVVALYANKASLAYSGSGDLLAWMLVQRLNSSRDESAYWFGDLGTWSPGTYVIPPAVNVTVNVGPSLSPAVGVDVLAADPSAKFLAWASYPYGKPQLTLYPGTFDVVVVDPSRQSAFAGRVTVAPGTQTLAPSLAPSSAAAANLSVDIQAWNATRADALIDRGWQAPMDRMLADAAGDFDGNASLAELQLWEEDALQSTGMSLPIQFSVDNVTVSPDAAWIADLQGAGPILSTSSVSYSLRNLYEDPLAPDQGVAHRIELEMPYTDAPEVYATSWMDYSVHVSLFGAATAQHIALGSHMPELDGAGFLFAPNATLLTAGPNAWSFVPGTRPANQSASNDLLFRIDATGPAYEQPKAMPPSFPVAPPPPADLGVVALGLAVVGLIAVLSAAAVLVERRRRHRPPPRYH